MRPDPEAIAKLAALAARAPGGTAVIDREALAQAGFPKRTGWFPTAELAAYLAGQPGTVDAWLTWSADQRSSPAWYFTEKDGGYEVGFFPGRVKARFSDKCAACAEFIALVANHRS